MSMTGVLRPGHVQIRVLDMDESVKFYTDVMGLKPMGKDAQGRAYFKTRAERDHNSIILRQADRAGMDFFGYKVLDAATLDALEKKLQARGVKTERIAAGELLETGERVRFMIPTGHAIELYADKTAVGSGVGCTNPDMDVLDAPGICPIRLDHALIYGTDLEGSRDLFTDVLGFTLVERALLEDGKTDLGVWLTCSRTNRLNPSKVTDPNPSGSLIVSPGCRSSRAGLPSGFMISFILVLSSTNTDWPRPLSMPRSPR